MSAFLELIVIVTGGAFTVERKSFAKIFPVPLTLAVKIVVPSELGFGPNAPRMHENWMLTTALCPVDAEAEGAEPVRLGAALATPTGVDSNVRVAAILMEVPTVMGGIGGMLIAVSLLGETHFPL
ncbi:MAG: hypothetical protein NTX64_19080 [Elusimicrobia bacterium]|nr:hypothetical protein [Elusimicrobiota bacterium]